MDESPGAIALRGRVVVILSVLLAASCGSDRGPSSRRVTGTAEPTATATVTAAPAPDRAVPTTSPSGPRATQASPAATPTAGAGNLAAAKVTLTRIATMDAPVAMTHRPGDDRLFVVEKTGKVRALRGGTLQPGDIVDVSGEVSSGSEQGLLGMAFGKDGSRFYLNFTNISGDTVIREYALGPSGRATEPRELMRVNQPFDNHNGGNIVLGPDGLLWIGLGDGGAGGDPHGNGQDRSKVLGKMLRIDPRASGNDPYTIPADNPYVGQEAPRREIWAYGLRNPWRYSFDRTTADLWIADVGQDQWEEINFAPASSKGGENYGWNLMEGNHRFSGPPPQNHHAPLYEYPHSQGCSITGGYVYRGSRIPSLQGAYVFGDYCEGRLRAFVLRDGQASGHRFLGPRTSDLASFGEDPSGELYVLSLAGGLFRIDPA